MNIRQRFSDVSKLIIVSCITWNNNIIIIMQISNLKVQNDNVKFKIKEERDNFTF